MWEIPTKSTELFWPEEKRGRERNCVFFLSLINQATAYILNLISPEDASSKKHLESEVLICITK